MRRSVASVESSICPMRGICCQVGHIWNRPIRMTLPDTKSVMKYALSYTRALIAKSAILEVDSSASGFLLVGTILKLFLISLVSYAEMHEETLTQEEENEYQHFKESVPPSPISGV
eukprot:4845848-Pleurochrysis_carterae.AAC.1